MISLREKTGSYVQSAVLVTVLMLLPLFGPEIPPGRATDLCVTQKYLAGLKYLQNCDSYAFVRLAQKPGELLQETGKMWQSRPGYAVLGYVAAIPFRMGNMIATRIAISRFGRRDFFQSPVNPYYAGYILLNWIALVASSVLFLQLVGSRSARIAPVLFPLVIVLLNGITKGFFWSPHLQMLNILIPLIAMSAAIRIQGHRSLKSFIAIGLVCGIASLVYGAFILVLATGTISAAYGLKRANARHLAVLTTAGWIAFALPIVAWRSYVIARTGEFYMHETAAYHQFVWILETAADGIPTLVSVISSNLSKFGRTLLTTLPFPVIVLGVALAWLGDQSKERRAVDADVSVRAALAFLIVATPFFALMGFYTARLTWQLVPPLMVMAGIAFTRLFNRSNLGAQILVRLTAVLMSVAYAAYIVVSDQTSYLAVVR